MSARTSPATVPAVEVRGLHFSYPDRTRALKGLDLQVAPGERVALLGPNGAGKTTLALHLNGVHQPLKGTVSIDGVEVGRKSLGEVRRKVQLVFQDADDQLFMPTVGEDVAFGPANQGLRGDALAERVRRALADVGLTGFAERAPHHLSGGERRRAAIATVLSMHPSVMVLDEPTSGLDPAGRRELVTLLQKLEQTQLLITHDLPFALELCERAVVIDGGVVVADGATADLLDDAALLRAHRLELPYGFDPRSVAPARSRG